MEHVHFLQNESGEALGGINTDDEPVPEFVHRLAYFLVLQPTEIPASFCQENYRSITVNIHKPQ